MSISDPFIRRPVATILLTIGLSAPGSVKEIPWEWLAGGALGTTLAALLLWQWGSREPSNPLPV